MMFIEMCLCFSLPSNTDYLFRAFLGCVFQKDPDLRYTAEDCLKLGFFQKFHIPNSLPFDTLFEAQPDVSHKKTENGEIISIICKN